MAVARLVAAPFPLAAASRARAPPARLLPSFAPLPLSLSARVLPSRRAAVPVLRVASDEARMAVAERKARKESERRTYLVAAVMSSLGITSMAAAAVYYRFAWQMEGGEIPVTEMLGTFALSVGAAVGMEFWARWAHRALWHASLWDMHASHHRPRDGPFELNDVFAIVNAVPAMALLAFGFFNRGLVPGLCFGAGLGITLFGMAYMFVHDGLVHRRFPVGPIENVPYFRRVASSLKLSFKKKSGEANPSSTLLSTKGFLERPLAGSQVQLCLLEKKVLNSWSHIEPGTFRVRGSNYLRDKKKELAQNCAAYYPFGVDVYLSPQKLNHISRFVKLPDVQVSSKLPPLLVVNVQVPLYPASLFQSETDGEGMSFVLYFRLSEGYSKELPPLFIENIRRLVDDDVEKIKAFPMETTIPFRERLKILGRVANLEDLPLSAAERKLMHAYNEKPVLSRPQHQFFLGDNYFEVDIDMHRFGYISRKGFETFLDRLKICMLDVGLTIQGNKPEELPEQVLCCVRLNGIDYAKYQPLMTNVA